MLLVYFVVLACTAAAINLWQSIVIGGGKNERTKLNWRLIKSRRMR